MNALLIFIRNPELGKVKSRLAATLGHDEALRIYRILLEKTHSTALQCSARRLLFYSDFVASGDEWAEPDFEKKLQKPVPDLGDRMEAAFAEAFAAGAQKALIIGSDCPDLSPDILEQAYQLLDTAEVVIGPASDGGYYLLGLKKMEKSLFQDMVWSTDTVFSNTVNRMETLNKTYALLPRLSDIDTAADWLAHEKLAAE